MATTAPATPATDAGTPAPTTLEQKIELAAAEAAQVASLFSPAIGKAIEAGVSIEPILSGFFQLLIGIFKHHTKAAVPAAQAPAAQ